MMVDHASTVVNGQPPPAVLDLRLQIEDYLRRLVFSGEPVTTRLGAAMRYSLLAGGERVRPVIALATAEVLRRAPASVLPLAAGLEMIHTHALVHLDLPAIEDDDVRRGRPSAHVAFGHCVALLAGDALFAEAMALVLREQEGEPARVLAAAAELMRAVGVTGLLGGLYIDVTAAYDLDECELRQLYELKTGRLLAVAVETVLTLTGESGPSAAALRRFAAEVGVLFQIVEDILQARTTGKPRGSHDSTRQSACSGSSAPASWPASRTRSRAWRSRRPPRTPPPGVPHRLHPRAPGMTRHVGCAMRAADKKALDRSLRFGACVVSSPRDHHTKKANPS